MLVEGAAKENIDKDTGDLQVCCYKLCYLVMFGMEKFLFYFAYTLSNCKFGA